MVEINIRQGYGWHKLTSPVSEMWFKGYLLNGPSFEELHSQIETVLLDRLVSVTALVSIASLAGMNGNFSLIVKLQNRVFSMLDRVGSIPLIYSYSKQHIKIGDLSVEIARGLDHSILESSALEISMSGYTIGRKTLYKDVYRLTAGEILLFDDGDLSREYYYTYTPWLVKQESASHLKKKFSDAFLSCIKDIVKESSGRQIVVPLSAGRDSRAVVSALKHVGGKNVVCFSYGRSGNFETKAGHLISKKLGYKWIEVRLTLKGQRKFQHSSEFKDFLDTVDLHSSSPHIQEVAVVSVLKRKKLINSDAIIINGSTGDYISGSHISRDCLSGETGLRSCVNSFLSKHYTLWGNLRTDSNDAYIYEELRAYLENRCNIEIENIENMHGLSECIEYLGRQSKYIMGMQRVYEFYGFDWRLPFWSSQMMDFWESVPVEYKYDSALYKDVLTENNWEGVWCDEFNLRHRPLGRMVNYLRLFLKLIASPFGKRGMQFVDKNIFGYISDITCNSSIVPYYKMLLDMDGYRNNDSWISKRYLEDKRLR